MKGKKIAAIFFCLMTAAVPFSIFLTPRQDYSPEEGRPLAAFPEFSVSSVASGQYTNGIECWLQDHFPMRRQWIGLRTAMERSTGRREIHDIFITKNRMIENPEDIPEQSVFQSAQSVVQFAERFDGPVSLMIIPTASEIYRDLLPVSGKELSQKTVIDRLYEQLPDGIGAIDCYTPLYANQDLYIYYRTDPCWTSLGAYLGYAACGRRMGFTPVALERLNIEHACHDFRGSLYRRTMIQKPFTDTIDLYYPPAGTMEITTKNFFPETGWMTYEGLYRRDRLNAPDPLEVFLGPEAPVTTIETSARKGGSLLVFRDRYADALLPFLTLHYSKITLVNPFLLDRPAEELIPLNEYDQALLCFSFTNFASREEPFRRPEAGMTTRRSFKAPFHE